MSFGVHAIILAGAHQWRPSVFERWLPRTLVPIANRPLIDYPLSWLRSAELMHVRICANSDTHFLKQRLGHGASHEIGISFYEDHLPRGPAGCAADAARDMDADTFVLVDGTIIPQSIHLPSVLEDHASAGAAFTIVAHQTQQSTRMRPALVPTGVYICSRRALRFISTTGYQDIKEMLLPRLHDAGEAIAVHTVDSIAPRVSGAATSFGATAFVLSMMLESPNEISCYERRSDALVHDTARIGDGVHMLGPVLIGADTVVEDGAMIVGPTSIGEGCRIKRESKICRSILWNAAAVGESAYVDHSILTFGSIVPAEANITRQIHYRSRSAGNLIRRAFRPSRIG
ncbi:MAG: NDP-sugar synthase [Phycisphaerae bacterium]|nr:NDP-sugar synthase [Phycisphaerae bacterium]